MSGVPCKHWSDCGVVSGGCCAKNLHGGKPSAGTCMVCNEYDGPSRGLGDTIERFTRLTGLNRLAANRAKKSGKDCGCDDRRVSLNQRFPYRSNTTM